MLCPTQQPTSWKPRKAAYQYNDTATVAWSFTSRLFVVFTRKNHNGVLGALELVPLYQYGPFTPPGTP